MAVVAPAGRFSILLAVLLLAACAPWQPSPDSPRKPQSKPDERVIQTPPAWYRVERGDTLYSIAFRYGLDWRRVARWNSIGSPYTIRPGQELRMTAPPAPPPRQSESSNQGDSSASSADDKRPPQDEPEPERAEPTESRADPPSPDPSPAPSASGNTRNVSGVAWQWPTDGRVARSFDPADTRKGIGVAGKAGQAVLAAAAGQVVYSGTALIGYGELIIIKHSDKLLSAYGHNRRRLVGEGDSVKRGQEIAEMGQNDRQENMLHFEIRLDGEPVNPLDYLPRR
ncbi:peptidoglycan DD-metalloendopeptidase family protein [Wenzhouxiangella sp. EGI_FJ10305]|uniref:peptidoglycan DD-metalloendopeptidase family protein n=1 Tax=Wenzhouxiangella sp. EGI_FJ10305 TaxID=3243768 RepID=UPI0035E34521